MCFLDKVGCDMDDWMGSEEFEKVVVWTVDHSPQLQLKGFACSRDNPGKDQFNGEKKKKSENRLYLGIVVQKWK